MNFDDEFLNVAEAEAKTRLDYNPPEGPLMCDRKDCDKPAVPGELQECAAHQIESWQEIMASILADPDITDIDCDTYSVGLDELERLKTL